MEKIKPSEIFKSGSGKKYWWKGKCGHEWDAVISSRITIRQGKTRMLKPSGCPYCSNPPKRVLVGFNDLETWCKENQRETLLIEWDYEKNAWVTVSDHADNHFWDCETMIQALAYIRGVRNIAVPGTQLTQPQRPRPVQRPMRRHVGRY